VGAILDQLGRRLPEQEDAMSVFTDAETNYFESQQLGRLATLGQDGMPHVVPVAYRYNPDVDIDIGGHDFAQRKKFRDVQRAGVAALVVDDVLPPWQPAPSGARRRRHTDQSGPKVKKSCGLPRARPSQVTLLPPGGVVSTCSTDQPLRHRCSSVLTRMPVRCDHSTRVSVSSFHASTSWRWCRRAAGDRSSLENRERGKSPDW
jgi:pyridoxamine 5'-phosphate oxidase family protein